MLDNISKRFLFSAFNGNSDCFNDYSDLKLRDLFVFHVRFHGGLQISEAMSSLVFQPDAFSQSIKCPTTTTP